MPDTSMEHRGDRRGSSRQASAASGAPAKPFNREAVSFVSPLEHASLPEESTVDARPSVHPTEANSIDLRPWFRRAAPRSRLAPRILGASGPRRRSSFREARVRGSLDLGGHPVILDAAPADRARHRLRPARDRRASAHGRPRRDRTGGGGRRTRRRGDLHRRLPDRSLSSTSTPPMPPLHRVAHLHGSGRRQTQQEGQEIRRGWSGPLLRPSHLLIFPIFL
jgi:hypothetical protein